jgi:hypothetical protein
MIRSRLAFGVLLLTLSTTARAADPDDGPMQFTVDTIGGTTSRTLSVNTAGRCAVNAAGSPVTAAARKVFVQLVEEAPLFATIRCETVRAYSPLPGRCNLFVLKKCAIL